MTMPQYANVIEKQIDQWRSYLRRRQAIHAFDIEELEDHLREQIAGLVDAGLAADEAFLVAVKRMGDLDTLSREFAHEHAERLWKQLVTIADGAVEMTPMHARTDAVVALCLAVAAAVATKVPVFFGIPFDDAGATFYARNASLFVLPFLAGYFAWKRRLDGRTPGWLCLAFIAAAVLVNVWPFPAPGKHGAIADTETLLALHLPIALWLVVGVAYAGSRWKDVAGRMDFIRFTGELVIYYVLIALGGGVFTALMAMIFQAIGIDVEPFLSWLIPCGAAGAVIVAAWLVEAKQSVIENMAPVLTRLFTPLFVALLIAFLVAVPGTGHGVDIARNVLIAFDLVLVVVLGLLLYSISARDPSTGPGLFDVLQVVLVASAVLVDAVALWAIAARISEFGFTPNRVAALGENVVLLANLLGAAVLHVRFLRGRGSFASLERWQADYLYVYAGWAAIVVIVFPPAFGYI